MRYFVLFLMLLMANVFAQRDPMTDAFIFIDWEHHEVHDGDAFVFSVDSAALSDGDTLAVIIQTPNTDMYCHIVADVTGALDTKFKIFEDDTHVKGTQYSIYNRNRNSSATNTTLVYDMGAGYTAGSTAIFTSHFGVDAGIGVGAVTGGGEERGATEFILKKNTQYLYAIMSLTDQNVVSMKLTWYEQTPIPLR